MNKIVELLIDWDNLEFDDLGVSIMSLVSEPAIGIAWQKFAAQKFVSVLPGESKEEYVARCIPTLIDEGFEEDQAAAICYGSYEDTELKEPTEEHMDAIELMLKDNTFGRTFDPKNTSFVNLSKDEFATAGEVIEGIGALNNLLDAGEDIESNYVYKYTEGQRSANRRRFCSIMMAANRFFSLPEINAMSAAGVNGGFAESGKSRYDIFKYHGGLYCRHFWTRFRVFKDGSGREVVVEEGPARGVAGVMTNDQQNRGRMTFNESKWHFSEDDKMIVTGPAMVPNMMIPRIDKDGSMFHVYFSQDTVKKIARKFLEENNQHNTDINHDDKISNENTLLESWIVDNPEMDKSTALGFNVPEGTWMVSYKINNKETWNQIKEGELNGFSITGQFIESNTK